MSLDSIVSSARKAAGLKPLTKTVSIQKFPRKESFGSIIKKVVNESIKESNTRIIGDEPVPSWNKCPNLKQSNGEFYCTKFFSLCAKEKCPAKLRM